MNNMRVKTYKIMLDKERNFCMNNLAFSKLEEAYGSMEEAVVDFQKHTAKSVRVFTYAGLVGGMAEDEDENSISEKFVGRHIGMHNQAEIIKVLVDSLTNAMPVNDEESQDVAYESEDGEKK